MNSRGPRESPVAGFYLVREPALVLPLVALVINVLLIAFMLVDVRRAGGRVRVAFASQSRPAAQQPGPLPVLTIVAADDLRLDAERMTSVDDVEFRLRGRAGEGSAMVIRVGTEVPAEILTSVLQCCARAGYGNVALENVKAGK